jgi:hypothetical protein
MAPGSKVKQIRRSKPKDKPARRSRVRRSAADECVIPGPVPSVALARLKLKADAEHEVRHVREYMEWQARDERVVHLEKVASERVFNRKHDVWDVHTDRRRWWVITSPTNLYSQEHFPSLDYILSFHVGLMARVASGETKVAAATTAERERFLTPWRRWEQASEALDVAEEAEDFQAIGMRCRECLIELVQGAADLSMLKPGEETPKRADFIHWSEVIVRTVAHGSSAEELRGFLRASAKATWQFVNWLTHSKNATRADAQIALESTGHVLSTVGSTLVRHETGAPERCPSCSSYQVTVDSRPDIAPVAPSFSLCARCGWASNSRDDET